MITTKPNVAVSGLYTQSQAARELHVDRHTIRRYESDMLLTFRVRRAGLRKVTTGREIIDVWQDMLGVKGTKRLSL